MPAAIEFAEAARVPEINAIVGRHSFEKLDSLVARRHELISAYQAAFKDLQGVTCQQIPPNRRSSGNYFTLFISDEARASRDEAYHRLNRRGIQTKKYFYPALHLQAVYRSLRETYPGSVAGNVKPRLPKDWHCRFLATWTRRLSSRSWTRCSKFCASVPGLLLAKIIGAETTP